MLTTTLCLLRNQQALTKHDVAEDEFLHKNSCKLQALSTINFHQPFHCSGGIGTHHHAPWLQTPIRVGMHQFDLLPIESANNSTPCGQVVFFVEFLIGALLTTSPVNVVISPGASFQYYTGNALQHASDVVHELLNLGTLGLLLFSHLQQLFSFFVKLRAIFLHVA